MNKTAKKVLISLAVVLAVLAVVSQLYSYYSRQLPEDAIVLEVATTTPEEWAVMDLLTADEKAMFGLPNIGIYEVVSRNESGLVTDYRLIGMQQPQEIALDLMTDEEKVRFGLQNFQVQVLHRNAQGNITAYHIMKDANDIVTAY